VDAAVASLALVVAERFSCGANLRSFDGSRGFSSNHLSVRVHSGSRLPRPADEADHDRRYDHRRNHQHVQKNNSVSGHRLESVNQLIRPQEERLPLQLFLELVEEPPVGALSDDLLGARFDHPGLVQT